MASNDVPLRLFQNTIRFGHQAMFYLEQVDVKTNVYETNWVDKKQPRASNKLECSA